MAWTRTSWIGTDALPDGMTHLALPILKEDHRGHLLIFATARDAANRSYPVYADADLDEGGRLSLQSPWHVIAEPGRSGLFDESGLSLSDVRLTQHGFEGVTFGWRLRAGGGWFNEIGRLQMDSSGALLDRSVAPWQPRTKLDPISMAYPAFGQGNDLLYCAPTGLRRGDGTPSDFRIMRMNVKTGHREVLADPALLNNPGIFAFTRPWLHSTPHDVRIFLCMRGETYRIMSFKFVNMEEAKESGVMVEELQARRDGRESDSVCYPSLFNTANLDLMLYNGSGYGARGFGVAARERNESI